MSRVKEIIERAKTNPKKIVLPEANDDRIKQASERIENEKIAHIVPLEALAEDPLLSAAKMVKQGMADGFVAGAAHMSKDVIKAAIRGLGRDRSVTVISGAFLIEIGDCPYGEEGLFIFSDCAVTPMPSKKQLTKIAISSGDLLKSLFNIKPKIALLTYSSYGSAEGESIDHVRAALPLIKEKRPEFIVDGELQLDAAVVPDIQKRKIPDSPLKGQANVLIFPSLDAGNATYKAMERLGGAKAVGPVLLGLNKPCSDLSRGCNVDDIVNTVALTSVLAAIVSKAPTLGEKQLQKGKK